MLLDLGQGSVTVPKNEVRLGVMQAEGLRAALLGGEDSPVQQCTHRVGGAAGSSRGGNGAGPLC